MKNIKLMKIFQTNDDLNKGFPYDFLVERGMVFLVVDDFLVEIPIIWEFHYYARLSNTYQSALLSMKECLYPTIYGLFTEANILT